MPTSRAGPPASADRPIASRPIVRIIARRFVTRRSWRPQHPRHCRSRTCGAVPSPTRNFGRGLGHEDGRDHDRTRRHAHHLHRLRRESVAPTCGEEPHALPTVRERTQRRGMGGPPREAEASPWPLLAALRTGQASAPPTLGPRAPARKRPASKLTRPLAHPRRRKRPYGPPVSRVMVKWRARHS